LYDLPQELQDKIGPHPFVEALEIVESELSPESLNPWKHPDKRRWFLTGLRGDLLDAHKRQKKLAARRRPLFTSFLKVNSKGSKTRSKSKPRGTTKGKPKLKTGVRVANK
jgi:hypothetical protein